MTDQELQTLRNMGNECEAAADEIERLRAEVSNLESSPMSEEVLDILRSENERLRAALDRIRELSLAMALDDGLWFKAQTAPEAYLQQELRRLMREIEE